MCEPRRVRLTGCDWLDTLNIGSVPVKDYYFTIQGKAIMSASHDHQKARSSINWLQTGVFVCAIGSIVFAQSNSSEQVGRVGEIIANDVYVRSGPSTNHYTVTKLSAGEQLQIVGEESEWFEVIPPKGVFSLISGDYVDRGDGQVGVVNGSNVRVRAGSQLNNSKYTVQTKLAKGDSVTILGKNPDGFLRIAPPAGVTLWVNKQFVALADADDDAPAVATGMPSSGTESGSETSKEEDSKDKPLETTVDSRAEAGGESVGSKWEARFGRAVRTDQVRELDAIEDLLDVQLQKPLLERDMDVSLGRLQKIAEQDGDVFARSYAQARIGQLREMLDVRETVLKLRALGEQADAKRRQYLDARSKLHATAPPEPAGLDAQGELRESALYPPGSTPRRFRLVDKGGAQARTIAYVEMSQSASIEVEKFLGRYVGIRAASKRLQKGGVNAMPVFIANELVLLQQPGEKEIEGA